LFYRLQILLWIIFDPVKSVEYLLSVFQGPIAVSSGYFLHGCQNRQKKIFLFPSRDELKRNWNKGENLRRPSEWDRTLKLPSQYRFLHRNFIGLMQFIEILITSEITVSKCRPKPDYPTVIRNTTVSRCVSGSTINLSRCWR
jgi:hypothetical protein